MPIVASARLMAAFNGFYESPGPPPLGDACGIVPAYRHGHRNGHQSGHILHCCFVCCCCGPGGPRGDTERVVAQWRCPWLSQWPTTELYLFAAAAFYDCCNCSLRPCYGPLK